MQHLLLLKSVPMREEGRGREERERGREERGRGRERGRGEKNGRRREGQRKWEKQEERGGWAGRDRGREATVIQYWIKSLSFSPHNP